MIETFQSPASSASSLPHKGLLASRCCALKEWHERRCIDDRRPAYAQR